MLHAIHWRRREVESGMLTNCLWIEKLRNIFLGIFLVFFAQLTLPILFEFKINQNFWYIVIAIVFYFLNVDLKNTEKLAKNAFFLILSFGTVIALIRPVQYFGYRAYFSREPYVTAAAAIENSIVGFLPMPLVEEHIRKNNGLAWFFIKELSNDLGISDARTVNLTQKHIRGR